MPKPKPTTVAEETKALCDLILSRAAEMMQAEANAPLEMILDRLITYSAAQAVASFGRQEAIDMFRFAAGRIESGAFNHLDPSANIIN